MEVYGKYFEEREMLLVVDCSFVICIAWRAALTPLFSAQLYYAKEVLEIGFLQMDSQILTMLFY